MDKPKPQKTAKKTKAVSHTQEPKVKPIPKKAAPKVTFESAHEDDNETFDHQTVQTDLDESKDTLLEEVKETKKKEQKKQPVVKHETKTPAKKE